MATKVTLEFGALAPPLLTQLDRQGLKSAREIDWTAVQNDADAISRLYVCGLLYTKEVERVRTRFINRLKLVSKG